MCGKSHNLMSSCDDLFGLRTHMLSVMQIWDMWEQFIDSMTKDCRIKRSNESLFKTELSV